MTAARATHAADEIEEVKRFQRNLTEEAYQCIRAGTLSGGLPFGVNLSRRAIAEQLGIRIVPVGDAPAALGKSMGWWRAGRALGHASELRLAKRFAVILSFAKLSRRNRLVFLRSMRRWGP